MKLLKWLLGTLVVLVLVIGVGVAALVYLVDWNDFKTTIQNQVKKQTGRDLTIAGDLSPSVFPWAGITIGQISLANADGFGDQPFASIGGADVKVELLPLIKREINVRTVELSGLQLDLQRAADGTSNWDDLIQSTTTTTTEEISDDKQLTTEVEGSGATIAALAVGGIDVTDANVSWTDESTGTDAKLSAFNLSTGAIELEKPFDLDVDFSVISNSMDIQADVEANANLMMDLNAQVYSVKALSLTTDARGSALPDGQLLATLGGDIVAMLADQQIDVSALSLAALGIELGGSVKVVNLDTEPTITGQLSSNDFSPREMMQKLGIEAPVTADESVLNKANLSLALAATPSSAALNDLTITLDDTKFTGSAVVPSLSGAIPPLRFDFNVDAIDIDRYLPPGSDTPPEQTTETETAAPATTGDEPIELPVDMMRQLDIDGTFSVGSVKVSNLTTENIVIPVKATGGKLALQGMKAALYEGALDATASIDVTGESPGYAMAMSLAGIQASPLLADLLQKDAFLSGGGEIGADITTRGNSVNAIKAGLNGRFNTAFTDGSVNGINIGYQIRRAKAALTGNTLPEEEGVVKTDFSSLAVTGTFTNGVMNSDDLDMRSPLLRLSGAGMVDLPGEAVDYTLNTLITGTAQGQGGADLESLKGVKLGIPIRGTFDELAENFAGVILSGMKDNITGNLKNQAKAIADQKAAELKAQANEKAEAAKAQAEQALQEKTEELKNEVQDKAKDALKGLFK